MGDEFQKIKTFAQEVIKMCEDKGFTVAEVMYLSTCLRTEIDKQVSKNNFNNKFVRY